MIALFYYYQMIRYTSSLLIMKHARNLKKKHENLILKSSCFRVRKVSSTTGYPHILSLTSHFHKVIEKVKTPY